MMITKCEIDELRIVGLVLDKGTLVAEAVLLAKGQAVAHHRCVVMADDSVSTALNALITVLEEQLVSNVGSKKKAKPTDVETLFGE